VSGFRSSTRIKRTFGRGSAARSREKGERRRRVEERRREKGERRREGRRRERVEGMTEIRS
jgi:hypothetical protein